MTTNTDPVRMFRKKPVVVEAVQYPCEHPALRRCDCDPNWPDSDGPSPPRACSECGKDFIETLEGRMIVSPGDWIITGVQGEHYPCKPDIFAATYDPVALASAPPSAPVGVKRWPFVESPGEFTERLAAAMQELPLIGAVRHVLIENPPTLSQQPAAPSGEAVVWIAQCELDSLAATPEGLKAHGLVWSTPTGQAGVPLYAAPQQPAGVDAVLGFLPAPLTHSQAWPQRYVDGFNACAKLAEEQVRIALTQQQGGRADA